MTHQEQAWCKLAYWHGQFAKLQNLIFHCATKQKVKSLQKGGECNLGGKSANDVQIYIVLHDEKPLLMKYFPRRRNPLQQKSAHPGRLGNFHGIRIFAFFYAFLHILGCLVTFSAPCRPPRICQCARRASPWGGAVARCFRLPQRHAPRGAEELQHLASPCSHRRPKRRSQCSVP